MRLVVATVGAAFAVVLTAGCTDGLDDASSWSSRRIFRLTAVEAGVDGGPAVDIEFVEPRGVAVGPDGSIYITDSDNGRVLVVTP